MRSRKQLDWLIHTLATSSVQFRNRRPHMNTMALLRFGGGRRALFPRPGGIRGGGRRYPPQQSFPEPHRIFRNRSPLISPLCRNGNPRRRFSYINRRVKLSWIRHLNPLLRRNHKDRRRMPQASRSPSMQSAWTSSAHRPDPSRTNGIATLCALNHTAVYRWRSSGLKFPSDWQHVPPEVLGHLRRHLVFQIPGLTPPTATTRALE